MDKGFIQVYYGEEEEDASIALGQGMKAASQGKEVVIIRFLKEKDEEQTEFIKQFEPQIKLFRFEKTDKKFESLTDEEKLEEIQNIHNGLNYAKKVLVTRECDVLILDGLLEGIGYQILKTEDLESLIEVKDEETELILTGSQMNYDLFDVAHRVVKLESLKNNM